MSKSKGAFLVKGLIDVLLMLKKGKKSFTELKALGLSPSTVLARLREAQRRGWVKEELSSQKGKKSKIKYSLTKEGSEVLSMYEPVVERYLALRKELEQLEEEVRKREKEVKYLLTSVQSRNVSIKNS